MNHYSLNIAGYTILFNALIRGVTLAPSPSQLSFIYDEEDYDLVINVRRSKVKMPHGTRTVFRAPYVEEINGVPAKKKDKFWTVLQYGDYILIRTSFPMNDQYHEALVFVRPGEKSWDLVIDTPVSGINPFIYPLDGLILYYLTALNGDIFIHGSGVKYNNRGYLFTGSSGKGKSTMARLFSEAGAEVIHDDRLIIRKRGNKYLMYNTPVYPDEQSSSAELAAVYLIEHCKENISLTLTHTEAIAGLMSNCIQHHWSPEHIGTLTGAIFNLVTGLSVRSLKFAPDQSVVTFIENDE
ncbi:MAG TPA: hypothetical protein VMW76_01960 [Bacteroidales bacterium]|nr:hypothetical protein [Bacteroidales bacterium]